MKWLLPAALLVVICSPTSAQLQHGTVAVVYFTKGKIVVAADSRQLTSGDAPPDDTVCKIATPHGKLVFVSSGTVGYKSLDDRDSVQSWTNIEEVHRAYDKASLQYSTDYDRFSGTAWEWGNSISAHFESLLLANPGSVRADGGKSGVLTQSFMGWLESDGAPMLLYTRIVFHDGPFPSISHETIPVLHDCGLVKPYCPIGHEEIVTEFVNLTSERAKQEANTWMPPKNSRPADYDLLKTKRLVDLTIQYHVPKAGRPSEVGGKIDAVEMDTGGSMRWFVKENCAKD